MISALSCAVRCFGWCLLFSFGLTVAATRAADRPSSLLPFAVAINSAQEVRIGSGIYLGKGWVLTASHVVGNRWQDRKSVV